MAKSIRIIDISRPLSEKEPVYPGNPRFSLSPRRDFKKSGSRLSAIHAGLHSGTHIDAPSHYMAKGKTVDAMDVSSCMGWARVVRMEGKDEITEDDIARVSPRRGEILLFKTKNSRATRVFNPHFAYLTEGAARALVAARVKAVGIDGPSIRRFRLSPDTVHPVFLRTETPVYEGLQLKDTPPGEYYFIGLPLKIAGAEASPVRAILIKS